jgi:endoglucanase
MVRSWISRAFVIGAVSWFLSFQIGFAAAPTGAEMVVRMAGGINIGNAFDAPNGEGTWRPMPVGESEFDAFKAAGFKHVRLPVTWGNHMGMIAPYTIDPVFLKRIAEVVNWGTSRGLVVVLNAHHEGWFKDDPKGQAARFDALWRQIASAFKDVPDDLLVFEVLNESEDKHITDAETDEMNARELAIIRQSNPTRCVIIGAIGDNAGRLRNNQMAVPKDAHIIATFHSYDPWSFASGQMTTWGTPQDQQHLLAEEPNFNALEGWSKAHHCPLYLGEFASSTKVDPASRVAWYGFYAKQSVKRGFAYAVWDDAGNDEIYNRTTGQWAPGILQVLFPH